VRIPSREEFHSGLAEFGKREKRDAMYKVATFLVAHFWGRPSDMADGLGVLLLTWNQAFYRYGIFDFDRLETCIGGNMEKLQSFRNRDISSLSKSDEDDIRDLFNGLLEALKISSGRMVSRKSPVSVAKALHLLAPRFFPLWDDKIARAYKCYYGTKPDERYISFCKITKRVSETVREYVINRKKSLLKLIDEYNYSKHTKGWI